MAHGEQSDLLSHSSRHFKPDMHTILHSTSINTTWLHFIRILQIWHAFFFLALIDAGLS